MPTIALPLSKLSQKLAASALALLFPKDEFPETAKLLVKKAHNPIFVWDEETNLLRGFVSSGGAVVTPLTGTSVTGSDTFPDQLIEVEPAATIAALTINLEATDNVPLWAIKRFAFSQIVTTLTMAASGAGGGTIKGAAIAVTAVNTSIAYQKVASKTWRRLY